MAVTGFWPVFKNLKATLDYADNPDKTTAPEYLDEDLYAALRYAGNDDKTDRKMFVGGINCSAQNTYAEMIAVQRRFGLRGKVVGYHGIQSFKEGEVTPEQAFAIGKETARRMWGERYQVLVTVHLNTDNIHCHFVVNPVSFKDGAKFKNKIGDHKELRKISDEICREHELSVLENSEFYSKGKKKEYWVHKAGKQTHRDMLRRDVEEALAKCGSFREIEYYLKCLGYRFQRDFHYAHPSVIIDGWQRPIRIDSLGPQFCIESEKWTERFKKIAAEEGVYELNRLAAAVNSADMDLEKLWAVAEYGKPEDAKQLARLAENLDCFTFIMGASNYEEVGIYVTENNADFSVNPSVEKFFDYKAFGKYIGDAYYGEFVDGGFIYNDTDTSLLDILYQDEPMTMGGM